MNTSTPRKTLLQRLSGACLALAGWRAEVAEPLPPRCLIIGAHHTTWWDLIVTLLLMGATGVRFRWIAKDSLFRAPLGWLLRALGGMPVRRGAKANFVGQMVAAFQADPELRVAMVPEGTRRRVDHWKTGFYYIAHGAGVPIVLGYADYAKRCVGLGPVLLPSGDLDADFARYRAFYGAVTGRFPQFQGAVRHVAELQAKPDKSSQV
ncbi:1-acyl-sn-glycerol-3-phosphate acyltransferase [Candidatus Viridilinea mediisalina]|nr:1-acyl-sn-glycerol-3-phosphate acyltransferase [Candidatus Viridilinea mediisalina]